MQAVARRPESLRALILNADGRPLSTWPLSVVSAQDAISAVWRDRAVVIETWKGAFFRSPSTTIEVPKVLMLRQYAHVHAEAKFCRRSILLRDKFTCQYCGNQHPSNELTFDHVIPRVNKGRTVWENIVACCMKCNVLKADRRDMKPRVEPRRPTNMQLLQAGLQFLPNDIREDFGSWLYWNTELRA